MNKASFLSGIVIGLLPLIALAGTGDLIEFGSLQGQERLKSSQHKSGFFTLVNHFEAQSNKLFCGPTSATIVLNSLRVKARPNDRVPEDTSAFSRGAFHNLPASMNPYLKRYTQKTFFNKQTDQIKTMDEVLGATHATHVGAKPDFGIQLRQYAAMLIAHHLDVKLRLADSSLKDAQISSELIKALSTPGTYVIIDYYRPQLGQKGGGHISPLAAYDEASDSFLILDVNPTVAPWVWVKSKDLISAMRTFDTSENRGYLIVHDI